MVAIVDLFCKHLLFFVYFNFFDSRKVDWKISKGGESSFGETTVCRNELDGTWEPIFPLGEM